MSDYTALSSFGKQYPFITAALLSCLLGAFAINGQSFWIDELNTWALTQVDDFCPWLDHMVHTPTSDAQLPLYNLYMWVWTKFFPQYEVGLRLSNLPWLIVMLYPLLKAPVAKSSVLLVHTLSLILILHPLIWYYSNELRPYTMLMAGVTIAGVGLMGQWFPAEHRNQIEVANNFLIVGLALMGATSAIGIIWTIAFLVPAFWVMFRRNGITLGITSQNVIVLIFCALLMIPVAYQYVATFLRGIKATTVYEHKITNFVFGFYEIFGASGLGPGREELRVTAGKALLQWQYALSVLLYSSVVLPVTAYGVMELLRKEKSRAVLVITLAFLPIGILFFLGEVKHWRVVGRHMLPLLFFFALIVAQGFLSFWQARTVFGRPLASLVLVALLCSSLSITFGERHEREMYKKAAVHARGSIVKNGIVWWFADRAGVDYYVLGAHLVSDCHEAKLGTLVLITNPLSGELDGCARPNVALMSRQETFDKHGVGQSMLNAMGLKKREKFVGFEYWQ